MTAKTPAELFGIECGKGWAALYEPLIARCKAENVTITQIKEKWGGLRFYVAGAKPELWEAIEAAEAKSFTMCEDCGASGKRRNAGWIRTLCDEHAAKDAE